MKPFKGPRGPFKGAPGSFKRTPRDPLKKDPGVLLKDPGVLLKDIFRSSLAEYFQKQFGRPLFLTSTWARPKKGGKIRSRNGGHAKTRGGIWRAAAPQPGGLGGRELPRGMKRPRRGPRGAPAGRKSSISGVLGQKSTPGHP